MSAPIIHYGTYQGVPLATMVQYRSHWLVEVYIPMSEKVEAELVWTAIKAAEPASTELRWCVVCGKTKHHDINGCISCRGN